MYKSLREKNKEYNDLCIKKIAILQEFESLIELTYFSLKKDGTLWDSKIGLFNSNYINDISYDNTEQIFNWFCCRSINADFEELQNDLMKISLEMEDLEQKYGYKPYQVYDEEALISNVEVNDESRH